MEHRRKSAGQPAEDHEKSKSSPEDRPTETLGATRVVGTQSSKSSKDTPLPNPVTLGGTELGDFQLLKKLGEGAMGAVYKARQVSYNRIVALKVLFPHVAKNTKLVERLYREGRVMGQLDHANIVQAYEVGEDQGWHFVAMEYVPGESLQKWLDRLGRLSVGDALLVTLVCARALDYAHNLGLIHRDVKPDNILISKKGNIKVADLGMVKTQDEDMALTQTGFAVGTPWYMPLEQARNAKEIDRRSDVYALGCVLYCLLTGRPPFAGQTLIEVLHAKEAGHFPPARKTNPEVPETLDLIIGKMAAKLPQNRYQTCAEAAKALEGLGLANTQLGFLVRNSELQATKECQMPSTDSGGFPPLISEPAPLDHDPEVWYVRCKNAKGQWEVRKLTTPQISNMLDSGILNPTVKASHFPQEGFRSLATYKEFERAALSQISKTAADKQTGRYRALYKKIEEKELQEKGTLQSEKKPASFFGSDEFKIGATIAGVMAFLVIVLYFLLG